MINFLLFFHVLFLNSTALCTNIPPCKTSYLHRGKSLQPLWWQRIRCYHRVLIFFSFAPWLLTHSQTDFKLTITCVWIHGYRWKRRGGLMTTLVKLILTLQFQNSHCCNVSRCFTLGFFVINLDILNNLLKILITLVQYFVCLLFIKYDFMAWKILGWGG